MPGPQIALLIMITLCSAGCAAARSQQANAEGSATIEAADHDPWEPVNRFLFDIHMGIDKLVLQPVGHLYEAVIPEPIRINVHNAVTNLGMPHVIANDLLQGRLQLAFGDFLRFASNSTMGIGGLFDPATELGLQYHPQSLGVTFLAWGIDPGPYLVLPLFGPNTAFGTLDIPMRFFTNPVNYLESVTASSAFNTTAFTDSVVENRPGMNEVRNAASPYTFLREGYMQYLHYLNEALEPGASPFEEIPRLDEEESLEVLDELDALDDLDDVDELDEMDVTEDEVGEPDDSASQADQLDVADDSDEIAPPDEAR